MHIQKLASGMYQVRYRDLSGRERAKNFKRKGEASTFGETAEADKARGSWVDPRLSRQIYGDWVARWFGTLSHLKPWTRATYSSLLNSKVLPPFGKAQLGRIDTIGVQEWVSGLQAAGLSPSRIRQAHQLLRASLDAAVRSGYLASNPAKGVKLPREQRREMLFLDGLQVERLAAAAEPYSTLVYLLAYGGLRWGEAVALRRSRCDLLRSRLEIVESMVEISGHISYGPPKTYQRRTVMIPGFLVERLAPTLSALPAEGLVFTTPTGRPMRVSNFTKKVWKPALEAAALDPKLRIHDLRHTCASLLIAQGAHPKAIQAQLGHSSIVVTMDRYGHLLEYQFEQLAASLDAARAQSVTDSRRTRPTADVVDLLSREAKNGP